MSDRKINTNNEKLFAEFPKTSTEEWESVIIKDLKGADYNKKLIWNTLDNINVRPFTVCDSVPPIIADIDSVVVLSILT